MALDKAIKHGKEKRQPYRRSKAFDRGCRHGGGCDRCENDRRSAERKLKAIIDSTKE